MQKIRYFIQAYPLLCIGFIFLIAELIINPIGNFPLNDDWWYADSYKKLFEDHTVAKIPWGATSLVGQLLLTKPFAVIFGSSYSALRCFTLVLSLFCIRFIFKILTQHLNVGTVTAFFLSLVFLCSPLFIALSNSYMSDIPFLFFLSGGFYFYFNYRRQFKIVHFTICILFFMFAILTRQLTVAFLLALVIADVILKRRISLNVLLVLIIPGLTLFCFECWIQTKITNPIYTYVFFRNLPILNKIPPFDIFINLCKRWIHFINYSAFVLFPLLIPYLVHYLKTISLRTLNKEFMIAAVLYVPIAISMNKFPLGNYLFNFGIGPDTLYDFFTPEYGKTQQAPVLFVLMKTIAYVSSFSLLLALSNFFFCYFPDLKKETLQKNAQSILFICCMCFYYGAMCCTCAIFDRYIVPFTFLMFLLLRSQFTYIPSGNNGFVPLLALLFLFSTLGTKDYLNSHRARWEVIQILKKDRQASDKDINGGYEHMGSSFPNNEDWYPKWANVPANLYVVTRQSIVNYTKLGSYVYQKYLPFKKDSLFYSKLNSTTTK